MSEETLNTIKQKIIDTVEINGKLVVNKKFFKNMSNLSNKDKQELKEKLNELGISKLKLVKYSEKNAIKASAKMDEFPNKDEGYGYNLDEMMDFLSFKNINSLISGEEYIYI